MSSSTTITVALIEALGNVLSSLAWPAAAVLLALFFREQLAELIGGIKSIKVPGGELFIQKEDPDAPELEETGEEHIVLFDPKGFRTEHGIEQLIHESGFVATSEKVLHTLLILETARQHTWLATTNKQIICVLDDEKTRANGRLIQWLLPLTAAEPVRAYLSSRGSRVIDIGRKRRWLYSRRLYQDSEDLERDVKEMIQHSQSN